MFKALTQARSIEHLHQYTAGAVFPGVELPNRESDHFPPTNVDIKAVCSYNSTPYSFMACKWTN